MTNLEIYTKVFVDTFGISEEEAKVLKFQDIKAWDSVGHMGLIANLEEAFNIMMETDDIIDLNSFEKGKELLAKYDIDFAK
ncbi:MAG: acyl carrier protein [Spirochaetia bacterium]|jgi:acyl carrier protein|nr:acyl carrier protein [Spirochaetia bacterium]